MLNTITWNELHEEVSKWNQFFQDKDILIFYRFCQIKSFLLIRHFKIAKKGSDEHKVYSKWVINFISNLNPDYTKVTYFNDLSL